MKEKNREKKRDRCHGRERVRETNGIGAYPGMEHPSSSSRCRCSSGHNRPSSSPAAAPTSSNCKIIIINARDRKN